MPNTNCLEGVRCPRCGYEDAFMIDATVSVIVTDEGTSDREVNYEWDDDSYCCCQECQTSAKLRAFRVEHQIQYIDAVSFIRDFINLFPELDDDEAPLAGSDCVERVALLRKRADQLLPPAQKGVAR